MEELDIDKLSPAELDNLLEDLEKVVAISPADYVPHDKQYKFHTSTHKTRAMFGGNRSGKTEGGIIEAWFHASGDYPSWYPKEKRWFKPTRGRIIITDYKNGGGVLDEKIAKWFPKSRITSSKRFMGHLERICIRHKSGGVSTIEVLTHEQNDMAFEGWSGHWAWFDEPPPREKYVATQRGLVDFGGRSWLTLTPLTEPWLYDEIVVKGDDLTWFINVDIRDNPHLKEEDIKAYESSLTEEEKEARLHGNFRHLAGLVYKELDPEIHCIPFDLFTKFQGYQNWPSWFVLDPADRRPHHGIWAKIDPMGTLYVFDEIVFKGTISELSKAVLAREQVWKIAPSTAIRILDPNKGNTPSAVSGLTLVNEFAQHGLYFNATVNDDVSMGHLAVKERLHWDKTLPLSTTNAPKIYFVREYTKDCIRQLQSYVWDDWKGVSKGSRSDKEQVKDVNKDMPDCVRYLVMSNPVWYNPFGESDPIPFRSGKTTSY